jgi:hypothetical protein
MGVHQRFERSDASSNSLRHIYDAIYERLITASVTTFNSTRRLGLERSLCFNVSCYVALCDRYDNT